MEFFKKENELKVKSSIFIMVGQPGCGKSTFLKQGTENLFKNDISTIIISRDKIRFSLVKENEPYFKKEKQVYNEFIKEINDAIGKYDMIFVDATHLTKRSRAQVINKIHKTEDLLAINFIWLKVSLEESLKRNAKRKGRERVPDEVIKDMVNKFEKPTYEEDINWIFIVTDSENENYFNITMLERE